LCGNLSQSALIKAYNQNKDNLDARQQFHILFRIDGQDKIKSDFLQQNLDYLQKDGFAVEQRYFKRILFSIDNDSIKLDFLKQNAESLEKDFKTAIIKNIGDNNVKLDFLKQNKDTLDIDTQVTIVQSFSDEKLIINFLEQNKDFLISSLIADLIRSCKQDTTKVSLMNKYNDSLDLQSKIRIICSCDHEKIKLDYLDTNPDIPNSMKIQIIKTLSFDTFSKLFSHNSYNCQSLISLSSLEGFSEDIELDQLKQFIGNNLSKLDIIDILHTAKHANSFDALNAFSTDDLIQILDKNQNQLSSEHSLLLITQGSPNKHYYTKLANKLNDLHKYIAILHLKETQQDEFNFNEELNKINLSNQIKNLATKIFTNLGTEYFVNPNAHLLLSEKGLACFDEETIYNLFKDCIVTNLLPNVSNALENPELFNKYLIFRKQNLTQNPAESINICNAIAEFNRSKELIQSCLKEDMTEQEQAMFISALNNKDISLSNKEDLKDYPNKRSEYIEQMASRDLTSAITYILTGMDCSDYFNKRDWLLSDEQLSIGLNDFSEELQEEIIIMQAIKDTIDLILNEPKDVKFQILQIFKQSCEQEFTQGSPVADLRKMFPEFETHLKSLYGKELETSLSNSQLPDAQKIDGIDVIHLNGENFKMLVHGLNAYGDGSAVYEPREIGQSYICTSLISQNTISRAPASIYYGFKQISGSSLALEAPYDIWSYAGTNSRNVKSLRTPKFLKTEQLEMESQEKSSYSEIVLFRDQIDEHGKIHMIMPDYIVAFGEITEQDKSEAIRLGIPIVVINEEIYAQQIEENKKRISDKKVDTTEENVFPTQNQQFREIILKIIADAKNKCSARQQEAIMFEMNQALKLMQEQNKDKTEGFNV